MLKLEKSVIRESVERAILAGSVIAAEGMALIADASGATFGVLPSAGTADDQFAGVSLSHTISPDYLPTIESPLAVGVTLTLAKTPLAGSLRLVDSTGTEVTLGNPATTTSEYSITGNVVTLHVDQTDLVVTSSYRYSPTTVEIKALMGDAQPGGNASALIGSVGVIEKGDIFTTEYDTSVDWSANPTVALGANGQFTVGGSGAVVPNCYVLQVPSADSTFLGLRLG